MHNLSKDFLPVALVAAAVKHISQLLTVKCLQISRLHQQSIFGKSKSVELSVALIQMNAKLQNHDWVDRLTWRLHRLVKLIKADNNQESRQKSLQSLKEIFWSLNMPVYRISSGIIPQVMQVKMSDWFFDICENKITKRLQQALPKPVEQAETQQTSSGLFASVYSYFTESAVTPDRKSVV